MVTARSATTGDSLADRLVAPAHHNQAALDGLRALAVLLVLLVHVAYLLYTGVGSPATQAVLRVTRPIWSLGGTGVDLFFLLSAYLLVLPFARAHAAGRPRPSAGTFYARRCLRILPAYLTSLVVVIALFHREYLDGSWPHTADVALHVPLAHNWLKATESSINGPYWTLPVEADFYVLLPLLAIALGLVTRRLTWYHAALLAIAGGFALSTAGAAAEASISHKWPTGAPHVAVLNVLIFAPLFAMGAALSITSAREGIGSEVWRRVRVPAAAIAVALLGLQELSEPAGLRLGALNYYTFHIQDAVVFGALLGAVLFGSVQWRRVLAWAPLRFIGNISFSIYLYHYPVLEFVVLPIARHADIGVLPVLVMTAGVLLILLPLATASYLFIEQPFVRWARSR